ncbi:MAG: hypothetical protein Kow0092_07760 [Deferrisomatales bacterium]
MEDRIRDPQSARRLARTIVSDIAVYHKDAVERGIVEDRLFELLAEPIREGRRHYEKRVDAEVVRLGLYEKALVDLLLKPFGGIKSRIW